MQRDPRLDPGPEKDISRVADGICVKTRGLVNNTGSVLFALF